MNTMKYEGTVGQYIFQMAEGNTIEVWGDDLENPESYIFLKEGDVTDLKSFQSEIGFWFLKNVN